MRTVHNQETETQTERGEEAVVKVKFVFIISEKEIELAQAVSQYHRTGDGGERGSKLKYIELGTVLESASHKHRMGMGHRPWGKTDRNYNSAFCSPMWPVLV